MLAEKLLTLACAVGILACGACFVPDLVDKAHRPPPPPTPLRINLQGIRSLRVIAVNASEPSRIDSATLAKSVAHSLNIQSKSTKAHAHRATPGDNADATLTISILSAVVEPASRSEYRFANWKLSTHLSARLVRRDGQEIWSAADFEDADPEVAKDEEDAIRQISIDSYEVLSDRLVDRMLYAW
jgi:hypothetical protein